MYRKLSYLTLFFVALSVIFSSSIMAKGGLTVRQTRIVFEADKGPDLSSPVAVSNDSDEDMAVSIKKADFIIAQDGAFQTKESGSVPYSAGDLISCEESEFIMKPGEKHPFDVKLLEGKKYLLPEYASTILVKYIPKSVLDGDALIKTYTEVAITVRVLAGTQLAQDIDTSIAPLEVLKVSGSKVTGYGGKKPISLTLKNKGLLTVEPIITASVSSLFSGVIEEIPELNGYVMPGMERTYRISVTPKSIFDINTITFNYEYKYVDKSFTDTYGYTYFVVSYQILIGFVLLLAGIIWQITLSRKKNRQLKLLMEQNKAILQAAAILEKQALKDNDDTKPQA
jgi:hypothetical protein